jgi:tripartite-type tricarboxylate transporter receptor subunit TctC
MAQANLLRFTMAAAMAAASSMAAQQTTSTPITVVLNWEAGLKK